MSAALRNEITRIGRPPDEARRRELCEAATTLLLEQGIARTSLADLASATGASARMLIHHFGSKTGVLQAALDEARRQQLRAAEEHLARAHVADLPGLLVAMWSFLDSPVIARHLRLFTEVAALTSQDPDRFPGFSHASVHDWLPALEAALRRSGENAARAADLATAALAIERGLLLDRNATGEDGRVDAAHDALVRLLQAR